MAMTYNPEAEDPGTITKVPAGDVMIDPNVRTSIRLDKSFVSSIRVYGFEQYPVGYQDDDGKTHITIGQRRVSAALEIGWPVIPIVIKPRIQAEADRAEEIRILTQLAENEQRTSLLEHETVAAYKQLSLLDVSEDQIARKTNSPRGRISTALKVADSAVAVDAIEKHELTLDQAAILVEFQDDAAALTQLQELASDRPAQLEHAAQRIREDRGRRADADARAAALEAAGWEVIREASEYFNDPKGATRLHSIWKTGDQRHVITEETALEYSDRVAVVYVSDYRWGDRLYLRNLAAQGLETYSYSSGAAKGPLSDEEKAARRQKRVDKAEMIAATEVRRAWIRDTLLNPSRKKYPDDAIAWITGEIWHAPTTLRDQYGHAARFVAETFLGKQLDYDHGKNPDTGDHYRSASDGAIATLLGQGHNPMRLALAMAVGSTEEVAGNPKAVGFGQDLRLAAYLRQLRDWGYTLADVEQRIVDAADAKRKKSRKKASE